MRLRRICALALLAAAPAAASAGVVEVHTWTFTQEGPIDTCHTYNVFDDAGTPGYAFDDRWIGAYGWCAGGRTWMTTALEAQEGEPASVERRPGQLYQTSAPIDRSLLREELTRHPDLLPTPGAVVDPATATKLVETVIERRRGR